MDINLLPHPQFGDPDITIGQVDQAKNEFMMHILEDDLVYERNKVTTIYSATDGRGERFNGLLGYDLLTHISDWSELEDALNDSREIVHLFIEVRTDGDKALLVCVPNGIRSRRTVHRVHFADITE